MSRRPDSALCNKDVAPLFSALGDPARLRLLTELSRGEMASITSLSAGAGSTRQAVTKHLGVLRQAGLVHGVRRGREHLWQLRPDRLQQARDYLDAISRQWDEALQRLKAFVEEEEP